MRTIRNTAFGLLCVIALFVQSRPVVALCENGEGYGYTGAGFCSEDAAVMCAEWCGDCGEDFIWCGGEGYSCSGAYWNPQCDSSGCWEESIGCDCSCSYLN